MRQPDDRVAKMRNTSPGCAKVRQNVPLGCQEGTTRMRQDTPGCARTKPNTSSMRQSASDDDRGRKMRKIATGCAKMRQNMSHECQKQPRCAKIRQGAPGQRLTQAACDRVHQMRQAARIVRWRGWWKIVSFLPTPPPRDKILPDK